MSYKNLKVGDKVRLTGENWDLSDLDPYGEYVIRKIEDDPLFPGGSQVWFEGFERPQDRPFHLWEIPNVIDAWSVERVE